MHDTDKVIQIIPVKNMWLISKELDAGSLWTSPVVCLALTAGGEIKPCDPDSFGDIAPGGPTHTREFFFGTGEMLIAYMEIAYPGKAWTPHSENLPIAFLRGI